MQLYAEMAHRTIPTDPVEGLQYKTPALVQTYDVMIEEGLPYAILTNGLAQVLLFVPSDDLGALYYQLCEPNREVVDDEPVLQQPTNPVARMICLCIVSFGFSIRDHE
jgi:hypothetical protein